VTPATGGINCQMSGRLINARESEIPASFLLVTRRKRKEAFERLPADDAGHLFHRDKPAHSSDWKGVFE
jgi:hypothetical protein